MSAQDEQEQAMDLDDTGQMGSPNPAGVEPLPPIGDPHRSEVLDRQIEENDPRTSAEESTDL